MSSSACRFPTAVTSAGISFLVGPHPPQAGPRRAAARRPTFARLMAQQPIAVRPDAANAQHYEVPPAFFALVLGPRRKYSCCLYDHGADDPGRGRGARAGGDRRACRSGGRPGDPGTRLRLGFAEPVDGRALSRDRGSPRCPTRSPQRAYIEARGGAARAWPTCASSPPT